MSAENLDATEWPCRNVFSFGLFGPAVVEDDVDEVVSDKRALEQEVAGRVGPIDLGAQREGALGLGEPDVAKHRTHAIRN
jgi:hypothetical protein